MPLLQRYRGLVCDLDGVVYRGPAAVPYAVEALRAAQVPVLYATNNASRTPDDVAAHLRDLGLAEVGADAVVTSSQAGARHLARRHGTGARVLAVGGPGVAAALAGEGLTPVLPAQAPPPPCVAVLQGYGAQVTAADLAEAAYAVQAGAEWVATNTDGTLPTDRGTAPGNGTLVAAVARACGTDPLVVGKPHAPLYELCAEVAGLTPGALLAVGDRLDTDIAGAVATGMDSALVLTGVDGPSSIVLAPPAQRPTYLLADLRGLHADYRPAVRAADGTWSCAGHSRRLVDGRWDTPGETTGPALDVEGLRCVVAALHEALDRGACSEADALRLLSEAGGAQ